MNTVCCICISCRRWNPHLNDCFTELDMYFLCNTSPWIMCCNNQLECLDDFQGCKCNHLQGIHPRVFTRVSTWAESLLGIHPRVFTTPKCNKCCGVKNIAVTCCEAKAIKIQTLHEKLWRGQAIPKPSQLRKKNFGAKAHKKSAAEGVVSSVTTASEQTWRP